MQYNKAKVLAILEGHLTKAEAAEAKLRRAYDDEKAKASNLARVALHDIQKAHASLVATAGINLAGLGVEGTGTEEHAKVVQRIKRSSDELTKAIYEYEQGVKNAEQDTYREFRRAVGRAYFYGPLKPFLEVAENMDNLRQSLELLRTSEGNTVSTAELENLRLYQFIVRKP